jgi:hypothetical protein
MNHLQIFSKHSDPKRNVYENSPLEGCFEWVMGRFTADCVDSDAPMSVYSCRNVGSLGQTSP